MSISNRTIISKVDQLIQEDQENQLPPNSLSEPLKELILSHEVKAKPVLQEKDNIIFIIAGALGLEAVEDKILVQLDKFRSGYECKDCNETGRYVACECLRQGREFGINDNGKACRYRDACAEQVVGDTCRTCKGTGSTVALPERAKSIPTSGIIVSIGPLVTKRNIGERVLFGAHTGYYLPFKGAAQIRCMREDEPLCVIHAIDKEASMSDFVQIDEDAVI